MDDETQQKRSSVLPTWATANAARMLQRVRATIPFAAGPVERDWICSPRKATRRWLTASGSCRYSFRTFSRNMAAQ